jgi:hypothetical protein
LVLTCLCVGCGEPVREDRTITFSAAGKDVGFQHGDEGVFVAKNDGGQLEKVFDPDLFVLATSTPLWSPTGGQMIFTAARDPQGQPRPTARSFWELAPEGTVHWQRPVVYTCYLRDETTGKEPGAAQELFQAACDHVGYVAANLAVRWHPKGDRVLYIDRVAPGEHAVFEFDLNTKASRQIFAHSASAMIFDWTPDGSSLVCVLQQAAGSATAGIWLGRPDEGNWWHVPESEHLPAATLPSVLEQLRAARPAWTRDGSRFAFASSAPGATDAPGAGRLFVGTPATREVQRFAQTSGSFSDLHWSPNGRLGAVVRGPKPSLHLLDRQDELSPPIGSEPVRQFAGWNRAGDQMGYVVQDELPYDGQKPWAFLLAVNPHARDAIVIVDGATGENRRRLFSGMRVTFAHWSTTDERMSLWVTFVPAVQLWFSRLAAWGLRPGDPAAVLDTTTGELNWMPVNATELAQVGHYFLLQRDYARAWHWYDRAETRMRRERGPSAEHAADRLFSPHDFSFFQYYCLAKLGRTEEAQARLDRFRRRFVIEGPPPGTQDSPPQDPAASPPATDPLEQIFAGLLKPGSLSQAILPDLYMAEALLSVDAAEDAHEFFTRSMTDATSPMARLSSALVLTQVLLLQQKHAEYAAFATGKLWPLLLENWKPVNGDVTTGQLDDQSLMVLFGGLALLPMFDADFLAGLPKDKLEEVRVQWEAASARDDVTRLAIDLVLHATYQTLGSDQEALEVDERIQTNPTRSQFLDDGGIAGAIKSLRELQSHGL